MLKEALHFRILSPIEYKKSQMKLILTCFKKPYFLGFGDFRPEWMDLNNSDG